MKRKINRMFIGVTTAAILVTLLLVTFIYYEFFQRQILEDLRGYTLLAGECTSKEDMVKMGELLAQENMRLTVIDLEGVVLYDTEADSSVMDNHGDRPEIQEALKNGTGSTVRRSATLSRNTFYYADRVPSGRIIRISKDASSIYSILQSALPITGLILLLLVAVSFFIAHFLTEKFIAPIKKMAGNLDEANGATDYGTDYEELAPFLATIQEQHRNLLKSAKMRQEFTANVSHELKTPLTAITGYAELIETGMASEKDIQHFAHGIHNAATRLLTLINDTIRLSELDSGNEQIETEMLDLYKMAEENIELLQMNAGKHDVTLALHGTPCRISGNRQMIEELIYNLCDNAIRYNKEGGRVDVTVRPAGGGCELCVRDTGIGIPKEHQERIFERFYRVDKSRSKSTGGTGLGLAIVKHIVSLHGAKLQLNSEPGQGTEITVTFRSVD